MLDQLASGARSLPKKRPGTPSMRWADLRSWATASQIAAAGGLLTITMLVARNSFLFTTPVHEEGDYAANSILVQQAMHFRLLVGNYSRVGFHHPGPAFLYVAAAGQALFYNLTHLVPAPYNGQALGWFVLNATLVFGIVRIVHRAAGTVGAAAVAVPVVFNLMTVKNIPPASAWFPDLYYLPFLCFAVACASVAVFGLPDLPWLVLGGGLLAHGHVSFLEFVVVGAAAVAGVYLLTHRRRVRQDIASHRGVVVTAAVIAFLFLLPMVLDIALHYPGEWGKYKWYVTHGVTAAHPLSQALRFMAGYWGGTPAGWVAWGQISLIGLVLVTTDRDRSWRRFGIAAFAAVALATVLFIVYAVRGVDDLSQYYLGLFYTSMPALVAVTVAVSVVRRIRFSLGRASSGVWITGAALASAVSVAWLSTGWGPQYDGDVGVPALATAIARSPQRGAREVAIQLDHDEWPVVTGLVLALSREGVHSCLVDPFWTFMFTKQYMCSPSQQARAWHVAVLLPQSRVNGTMVARYARALVVSSPTG